MFKFNFGERDSTIDKDEEKRSSENEEQLVWFSAKKILIPSDYDKPKYILNCQIPNYSLKLVDSHKVASKLMAENNEIIREAESNHSDLLPAKYEGGLKIWECTYDLVKYLLKENISLNDKRVLDLGCGAGIIGIIALLQGATVHFQDYNVEVINHVTIPNVLLNIENEKNCEFFCGDWESFKDLLSENEKKIEYDFIFSCETIYNPQNNKKLYNVFKNALKEDGIGFIAAKSFYFGVGGSIRQFEQLILEDGIFDVSTVWQCDKGLLREILKLQRKNTS